MLSEDSSDRFFFFLLLGETGKKSRRKIFLGRASSGAIHAIQKRASDGLAIQIGIKICEHVLVSFVLMDYLLCKYVRLACMYCIWQYAVPEPRGTI